MLEQIEQETAIDVECSVIEKSVELSGVAKNPKKK